MSFSALIFDTQISLSINGENYTVNARPLLQAAEKTNNCVPWGSLCNLWLSGPLSSEWVVRSPLVAADGTKGTNLNVIFSVRAYVGSSAGSVGDIRTDIIVENTDAFSPQEQPQYTAKITSGSATYTTPAITQYAYTRWHKILWWNNTQPQVYLQQNTQYIQDSKAISHYMQISPDESLLSTVRQTCAPLDHCDQTQRMGNTGAQPSIGPLPRWSSVYIIYPDVRAYNWMLANTDALGAYSSHYLVAKTGLPVSIQKHPNVTIFDWAYANQVANGRDANSAAYKSDLLQNCINDPVVTTCGNSFYKTGNPDVWDDAHQPSGAFLPYMVTGDYYYMSELAFDASYNELVTNEAYRGFSSGLIDGSHGQVRGKAWVLREMADAAWLLPDNYPLKSEFNADVENSIDDWSTKYTNNPNANLLGVTSADAVYSINGGVSNAMAPWQHNFLTWSAGHAADLGFAGAAGFRNWLAKFEIGLMTDWQSNSGRGFCWLQASAYNVEIKDAAGNFLPSYTAVYAATFPTLSGLACNSPAMLTELAKVRNEPVIAGEMSGYPTSSTGFPANFQIGIASAADSGLPNAQQAWTLFDSRSMKPSGTESYNDYPNFAVLPRFVPQTPVGPPIVNPPPVTQPDVWQTLTPSESVIMVGDTFTVVGTLNYNVGMTKPVTAYSLYGFDTKILSTPNSYTPKFLATTVGTTQIKNDNSGTTGAITIKVVPATLPSPTKVTLVGQILVASEKVITVGDTFTVSAMLKYSDGSEKPVTNYRLYGYDQKILSTPNSYTTKFVALKQGSTQISDDNSGVTGILNITVVAP